MKMALIGKLTRETKVLIQNYSLKKNGTLKLVSTRSGKVVDFSKHFFIVDFGNYRECFKYSQMFEQGTERVKIA